MRDRVCITPELHERMFSDLHDNHRGIEKMRHLSKTTIYWSRIDVDITDYVNHCKICSPSEVPDSPWEDLAVDFFTYNHKEYFLITDTFSKYPFIYQTSSKSADSIIRKLQNQFNLPILPPKKILFRHFHQKPSKSS